jgi:hypothetical protein
MRGQDVIDAERALGPPREVQPEAGDAREGEDPDDDQPHPGSVIRP